MNIIDLDTLYLQKLVGEQWFQDITQDDVNHFIIWARNCQVYRFPNSQNELNMKLICPSSAFRGYATGIKRGKSK